MHETNVRVRALSEALADAIEQGDARRARALVADADLCRAHRLDVAAHLIVASAQKDADRRLILDRFDEARVA